MYVLRSDLLSWMVRMFGSRWSVNRFWAGVIFLQLHTDTQTEMEHTHTHTLATCLLKLPSIQRVVSYRLGDVMGPTTQKLFYMYLLMIFVYKTPVDSKGRVTYKGQAYWFSPSSASGLVNRFRACLMFPQFLMSKLTSSKGSKVSEVF